MNSEFWTWIWLGLAVLLVVFGALRFDLLRAVFLRDTLVPPAGVVPPPHGGHIEPTPHAHADPAQELGSQAHTRPNFHRSGKRG